MFLLSRFFKSAAPSRSAEVKMGECQSDECNCVGGETLSFSNENWIDSVCHHCSHPMRLHGNPMPPQRSAGFPQANRVPALRRKEFPVSALCTPRSSLVAGIIAITQRVHIIQVRGTPASGKTTLSRLVANELFRRNEQVFYIDGWERDTVERAGGWSEYLESRTGVEGTDWNQHCAWLLLDEAQQSYWDEDLFSGFFKSIESHDKHSAYVILFVSYGSAGHALEESQGKGHFRTPMHFPPEQVIGFEINSYRQSLLLTQDEANDVVRRFMEINDVEFEDDLVAEMLIMSGGHSGCLVCLMGAVITCDDIQKWRNSNSEHLIPLNVVRGLLFDDQTSFFRQIYKSSFCRGLPPPDILQRPVCAKLLKHAVANDGINAKEINFDDKHLLELNYIWKKGWLNSNSNGEYLCFPSSIHRWYIAYVLCPRPKEATIPYETPLELVVSAIRHFIPSYLSDPPRSEQGSQSLLEDHFQKEIYRTLYHVTDGRLLTSPEYIVKRGKNGGAIDFFLPSPQWGVELVRDGNNIDEHLSRFQTGGQYHSLLVSNKMVDYIVLNFTRKSLVKRRPEHRKLYHVQFSQDFRDVEILDADLETKAVFTLSERTNPLFY